MYQEVAPLEVGGESVFSFSRIWRGHFQPLALWTLLCLLFFGSLLLGTERLPSSDFSGQFHAFGLFQASEVGQGRLPLWSPGSYAGFPFAADPQAAVFYPPRWLTILLSLRGGFSYYALQVEAILHVWLAGIFTYGLAYVVTRRRLAALVGAVAFGLGGYLTSYPILQLAILESMVWIPLALLLLHVGVHRARPLPWLVAAGLALALSALAGHPQTFVHGAYLAASYYLFHSLTAGWRWPRIVGSGALTAGVAMGTAAVAWLPALRLMQLTERSGVDYTFVASGLPMLDYVQMVTPGVFSFWSPQYLGVATLCLVLLALMGRRLLARGEVTFWLFVALVFAWLALGDAGILFRLAYYLPGLNLFRQQERLLGIFSLSLALLAAQGFAIWLQAPPAVVRAMVRRTAVAMVLTLLSAAAILFMTRARGDYAWLALWWPQLILAVAGLALLWRRLRPRRQAVALLMLLAVDLYVASLPSMNRQPGSPTAFWQRPAWAGPISAHKAAPADEAVAVNEWMTAGEPVRFDSQALYHANLGEIYGLEDVRGISPLKLQAALDFEQLPLERRWQLLNVGYVLLMQPIADLPLTLLAAFDGALAPDQAERSGSLYRYDAALPRAWMSYEPVIVAGRAQALQTLADPGFDPAVAVVFDGEVAGMAAVYPPGRPPLLRIERESAAGLAIRAETATPGYLVISEWAYPGWQATVNGRKAPLLRANYALQAIWLPAGKHDVTLRFRPPDVTVGAIISLLSLGLALAVASGRVTSARFSAGAGRQVACLAGYGTAVAATVKGRLLILNEAPLQITWPPRLWLRLRRRLFVVLVGLCWLGFALRLLSLGTQELRGDEGFSYKFAILPAAEIIPALATVGEPHSPLHYFVLHGWIWLAGESEFAMRFMAVVPSLLALPLMFQVGRLLAGRECGLLLALLLAVSHSQVWIGQDVRNHYSLVVFFSLLATLLLLRAVAKGEWRWWAWYAAAAALTVYSHYYGIFALLAHGVYVATAGGAGRPARPRPHLWAWLAAGLAAAAAFAPWLLLTVGYMARQNLYDPSTPELAHYLTAVGLELTVGSAFDHWLGPWLFLATLLLVVAGAWTLRHERPAWGGMLVTWLCLALVIIFLVRFRRSVFNDYYLTVAAPAWWLLAYSGWRQLRLRHGRWGQGAATLIMVAWLAANSASLVRYYTDPAYDRTIGYRALAAHVAGAGGDNDVFIAHFPDPALEYYLRRLPVAQTMQPVTFGVPQNETEAALAELAATYDRLWFAPVHHSNWDPENVAFRWLDYHNLKEFDLRAGNLQLLAYRPLRAMEQVLMPLEAELAGLLRLEGVFVAVDGRPADLQQPPVVRPGASLNVTLVWQGLGAATDDFTVFVHLLAEDGVLIAQHDGIPMLGTRPTTTWLAGERLIDRHEIELPAELSWQKGTLWLGLYHSDTTKRQAFAGGEMAIPLAELYFSPAGGAD
jgi:hypothetical protein